MHVSPRDIVNRLHRVTVRNLLAKSLIFTALIAYGQPSPTQTQRLPAGPEQSSVDTTLRFDVVSVKLSVPVADSLEHRQFRNTEPDRVRYVNVSLKDVLMNAYSLKDYQVIGPDWLSTVDVDIEGTTRKGVTKEQLQVMFQNLLVDRFKLAFHWDVKELTSYSILVGRRGPKIKESANPPPSANGAPPPRVEGLPRLDTDGFPVSPGAPRDGVHTIMVNGRSQLRGQRATMQDLANELAKMQLALPVTDGTGLKAKYDFVLKFATPGWNGKLEDIPQLGISASAYEAMEPLPELAVALQSQLGLKLQQKRAPVNLFVVERLEKTPTAN